MYIACRSAAAGEAAVARIKAESGSADVSAAAARPGVAVLGARLRGGVPRPDEPLHVLVNNAGVGGQRGLTADGFELHFGVNHLGHFALTQLLLPRLTASGPGARIVNVSSDAHYNAPGIDFAAVRRPTATFTGMREYSVSKLCNVLFTQELGAAGRRDGVHSYALHPGVVASDIWRRVPRLARRFITRRMLTIEQGAVTSVLLRHVARGRRRQRAVLRQVRGPRGEPGGHARARRAAVEAQRRLDGMDRRLADLAAGMNTAARTTAHCVIRAGRRAYDGAARLVTMDLPVMPPVAPMLAKAVPAIPAGDYVFEPKWDGFRSIVFRDGDEVEIGTRNERPMTRYFPELVDAVRAELPQRCVIDGEIVLPDFAAGRLDFEALQLRLHPAASRVRLLAAQTPAHFVAFDLLALGDDDYTERPFAERRAALEAALADAPARPSTSRRPRRTARSPSSGSPSSRARGLTASSPSRRTALYEPDKRVMFKIKHERTADCVVAGYRPHKTGDDAIGSLLLGLYRPSGDLASVGVIGAFPMAMRRELRAELEPLVTTFDGHPWNWARARPRRPAARSAVAARASARRAAPSTAGGTWARTCRSSRCARSASSRSATTTWRAPASGTRRSSSAGARTARRRPARSTSWKSQSATACRTSWAKKRKEPVIPNGRVLTRPWRVPKTVIEVAGREVAVSNPQKVYFPRTGHTKLDLVRYYLAVADGALRGVARPADGAQAVRERGGGRAVLPEARPVARARRGSRPPSCASRPAATADEVVLRDAAGLAWVANLGCIDLNPHPVLASDLDHPDELRVDLDPVPGVEWPQILAVALVAPVACWPTSG